MKVLIAEDDCISAQVLQSYLEKWGHAVNVAANGADAWRRFQNEDFSVVITDWMMPEMDGLELVRRIRAADRPGYVYIILLTAKSRKEDIVHGMDAGADDFLVKPFDREELRVRLRAGERIVQLEQSLASRYEDLETANARMTAVNRRMRLDLEAAAKIQQALLPTALPELDACHFAWAFRPCEELAGDNLGVVSLDERHVAVYVLDVSGHGVAAALSSVSVRHFLSPIASRTSLLRRTVAGSSHVRVVPPAEVAEELNRQFPMDATTGQFFTLLYGVLDVDERVFQYVSAGHPPPIYVPKRGETHVLPSSGFPIGIVEQPNYVEQSVKLSPGDRVYLYSDGIPESFNAQGEPFGNARLIRALNDARKVSLNASLNDLLARIELWSTTARPADDISALAVEMTN